MFTLNVCTCNAVLRRSFLPLETTQYKLYLPPATKLGQGYIFTGVCDSVHRGVSAPGVSAPGGVTTSLPPGRLLLRAVRILLECILVYDSFVYLLYRFPSFVAVELDQEEISDSQA